MHTCFVEFWFIVVVAAAIVVVVVSAFRTYH
jgi:hypothetical protein